ncbi:MAG: hypothetical protein H7338_09635 [Candidatus Sericytochromatia bacterium]|nr:hypothetical protein [Candidatus Sericytochromatia bacterium]
MSTGNYHQDKLIELLKRVHPMGQIGAVMLQVIREVMPHHEKIVACYYQLDFSEGDPTQGGQTTFYSSIVQLLTDHHFIDLGFYPKYHSQRVLAVHAVQDLRLENTFITSFDDGGDEEISTAESRGFRPVQTKFQAALIDSHGQKLENWLIEVSRPEQIENLVQIHNTLKRVVGKPLVSLPQ